jgi:hypothetical protein
MERRPQHGFEERPRGQGGRSRRSGPGHSAGTPPKWPLLAMWVRWADSSQSATWDVPLRAIRCGFAGHGQGTHNPLVPGSNPGGPTFDSPTYARWLATGAILRKRRFRAIPSPGEADRAARRRETQGPAASRSKFSPKVPPRSWRAVPDGVLLLGDRVGPHWLRVPWRCEAARRAPQSYLVRLAGILLPDQVLAVEAILLVGGRRHRDQRFARRR